MELGLKDEPQKESSELSVVVEQDKTFTHEELILALKNCEKQMKTHSERLILSDFELSGSLVTFKLMNQTLVELFEDTKYEITEMLRKELSNSSIQTAYLLIAERQAVKPRTEQEKYKVMLAKNPALKQFTDELGLDLAH